MTTLNLDLEIGLRSLDQMAKAVKIWLDLQEKNRRLMRDDLYEDPNNNWKGASAKNFYDEYNKVDSQIMKQLQEYQMVIMALYNEISEWYQKSLHLNPGPTPSTGTVIIGPAIITIPQTNPSNQVKVGPFTVDVPDSKSPSGTVTIDGKTVEIP